ncbi:Putative Serine phosphatase RsbU(GAF domain,29-176;Protein phosphatase 2C-like,228-414) [Magnetospirillum sp. XM-1]|uniref:ATP-binding SpoIIE family protein phosphatase n=1 Tax=Magnetospirillum sp. XM-1 TaxID=1663591 RepID=UPI00073DC0ED|nr:SpoIIE family protein phosphatase [Magnetospirillum sp. XM-1]CUW38331.1 Putative Serine phosphatase RsbU(GAF domain,29-176;Protein phosphatase 2C-like,228-414) [Magnetospirillum sp. XM-1]
MPSPLPETESASHLDLIVEMTGDFVQSHDVEATLHLGLERIAKRLGAEAASLFLVDEDTGELVCRANIGPVDVRGLRLSPGTGIVGRTIDLGVPQLVKDTRRDPDFARSIDAATGFETRSILCAPMSARGQRLGAIELFNKVSGDAFTQTDSRLLQALAASSALALINARLVADMAEQQSLKRELELAAEIQRAMLPGELPGDSPIHGINLAASGVSGDFYEIMPLADGRIAFAIGDVAGKGMKASLLMAKTASLFRCLVKREAGPGAVLAAINSEMLETRMPGMFVTMAAGVFDPAMGRVTLAIAGHEPPLLLKDGIFTPIEGDMPPLGIAVELFADGCPESVVDLDGGCLYLFTDGLTEARSRHDGMLENEGARALLQSFADLPAGLRLDSVVRSLDDSGSLRDDITLVVIEDRRERPPISETAEFERRYPARPDELSSIRAAVGGAARAMGCGESMVGDVVLAVDEACQNIIRHAYRGTDGDIVVHLNRDNDRLVIRLMDFAPAVDVAKIQPRPLDEVRPGGLGTHLMRSIMDHVDFLAPPPGIGNLLQMVKRIDPT